MSDKPNLLEDTWTGAEVQSTYPRSKQKTTIILKLFAISLTAAFLAGIALFLYVRFAPLPESDLTTQSRIVATDGNFVADLSNSGQNRIQVNLQDIPLDLQNATIDIEDAQFYEHNGLNLRGIFRAAYVDLRKGEFVEGGSSITQQLAKVMYLSHDRTFSRKFHEVLLTTQLEARYSKPEILEQYLNIIYYGNGANGVGAAANVYFNKKVNELTLAESAMLAGIPKGPSFYSPFQDLEKAKERQHLVLQAMVRNGHITQIQADEAFQQKLTFAKKNDVLTGIAPYFTRYATWSALNQHGVPEDELYRSGLTLQTTLDLDMQKKAEAAIQKNLPNAPGLQVALLALDPKTGHIKAMVGGKDFGQSSFNRVFAKRQPGSSFKPFVYLTALESGITPVKMYKSEPTTFSYDNDKFYTVKNFNDQYLNTYIDMREAVKRSDNVYAVSTLMEVTPQKVMETASRFGFESELKPYPSLALGVFPVSPMELARAYAALANGGTLVEPIAVQQVLNAYGRDIYERSHGTKQASDPQTIYIMTDLMKSVFEPGGTAARVASTVSDRLAAGKTGSTDTDSWMAGFTPNLVTVVWVGYDKDQLLSSRESYAAAQIWGDFMKTASENTPAEDFVRPEGLLELNIDPATGMLATKNCPKVERAFFKIGTEPTQECTEHHGAGTEKDVNQEEQRESQIEKFWKWFRGGPN